MIHIFSHIHIFRYLPHLIILLGIAGIAYAAQNSYVVPKGGTPVLISDYDYAGSCKYVVNNSGYDLFVPTATKPEWDSFVAHAPAGVVENQCHKCFVVHAKFWGESSGDLCPAMDACQNGTFGTDGEFDGASQGAFRCDSSGNNCYYGTNYMGNYSDWQGFVNSSTQVPACGNITVNNCTDAPAFSLENQVPSLSSFGINVVQKVDSLGSLYICP